MKKISNREAICEVLMELAENDKEIVVLTSDSRGSASLTKFAEAYPEQFVEVGIAEQNLVGIASGIATCGKKVFVASPASFLTMRSIEQVKIDVAYSHTNVKLIGISGGVSYGALGMSHHSLQDIAVMRAIPGINIIIPADRFETKNVIKSLINSAEPYYVRVSRNPSVDVYSSEDYGFSIGKAVQMMKGNDLTLIGTGETVSIAIKAANELNKEGIECRVLNIHTIKPIDREAILSAAKETKGIISLEEHSIHGGLGGAVAEIVTGEHPVKVKIIGIKDEPAIPGSQSEVFDYYGLSVNNIISVAKKMWEES